MRLISEAQTYLSFEVPSSLKVVQDYRLRYDNVSRVLDECREVLEVVHKDLQELSTSKEGRSGDFTTENILRALVVHQLEQTPWRETIVRISESCFLREFVRLVPGQEVMDFSFLCKAFKVIRPETWRELNKRVGAQAVENEQVNVSHLRVDSTVVETNIHYPSDTTLLWDAWRVLARILTKIRAVEPVVCPHRFHHDKVKGHFLYAQRYQSTRVKARARQMRRRFRELLGQVQRVGSIAEAVCKRAERCPNPRIVPLVDQLRHYLPLIQVICETADRSMLQGKKVPACERVFSLFEEHTELIKRGLRHKPVEFGHQIWLAQCPEKLITDYEVMEQREPDNALLPDILERHKRLFGCPPEVLAADSGFRADSEKMEALEDSINELAVPPYHPRWDQNPVPKVWRHFRAGIEGTISGLKRAFRLAVCVYRSFKSFSAAVGMAVFCHNLLVLGARPRRI